MTGPHEVFVGADAQRYIREAEAPSGRLGLQSSSAHRFHVVATVETAHETIMTSVPPKDYETLRSGEPGRGGWWKRTDDIEVAVAHLQLVRRPLAVLPLEEFRRWVPSLQDPGRRAHFVVFHHPDLPESLRAAGGGEFTCWVATRDGARPAPVCLEPTSFGASQLEPHWPVRQLRDDVVTIVGVGSLGSAAASSLARVGIGTIELVDPDRLLWHNLVRHELGPDAVGAFKVDAMAESLRRQSGASTPETSYKAHRLDVVSEAGSLLEVLEGSDIVLCCTDGVESRRVVNHMARVARTSAVFACVLDDGAIGEVARYRVGSSFGCLLCHRRALRESGELDPEREQDAPYGTGDSHRPMTASPIDLALTAKLAAKFVISTLLESKHGESGHSLQDEHCVIGLRPREKRSGVFGVTRSGETRWGPVPKPTADCPTCSLV
jgi:hypothetical protein